MFVFKSNICGEPRIRGYVTSDYVIFRRKRVFSLNDFQPAYTRIYPNTGYFPKAKLDIPSRKLHYLQTNRKLAIRNSCSRSVRDIAVQQ